MAGITEALSRVPAAAITTIPQGGGAMVNLRGVGASFALFNGSMPNAVYLDSSPFGFVTSAIMPDPNVYDLQRVEVLRGPQGTLYGANAESGVIRILTNDPDLTQSDLKARVTGSATEGGPSLWGSKYVRSSCHSATMCARFAISANSAGECWRPTLDKLAHVARISDSTRISKLFRNRTAAASFGSEADLQAPLVIRSPNGIAFTEFGRALVVHARLVLTQLDRAHAEIEAMRGAGDGKLTIGVAPWIALTFLPDTIRRFCQRMPHVQMEFFEGLRAIVQPRLRDGTLDFSIGPPPPSSPQSELRSMPLLSAQSAVVARRNHPRAACRSLLKLENAEWVLNWDPGGREALVDRLFRRHGMKVPRTIHLAHSLTIILSLLAHTDMLSIFPWPLVELSLAKENLCALPLRETVDEITVSVTARRAAPVSPAAECFHECLRETIKQGAASNSPDKRHLLQSIELLF